MDKIREKVGSRVGILLFFFSKKNEKSVFGLNVLSVACVLSIVDNSKDIK